MMKQLPRISNIWTVLCFGTMLSCKTSTAVFEDTSPPPPRQSPDILVIGDSQISYDAGEAHLNFFENLTSQCNPNASEQRGLAKLGQARTAAIGVRSSSLHTWVLPKDVDKAMICKVDEKWGVNAGAYGISNQKTRKYVQIGSGSEYQFCKKGTSPFQAMFKDNYYNPKIFVMAFLGNSKDRWAGNPSAAQSDVRKAMQQIPQNMPCIFMTTTPSFEKEENDQRQLAQRNIRNAFRSTGSRCSFVAGITSDTREAIEGNKNFFKTNDEGVVVDTHHPNINATRKFFELKRDDLCRAVFAQTNT